MSTTVTYNASVGNRNPYEKVKTIKNNEAL